MPKTTGLQEGNEQSNEFYSSKQGLYDNVITSKPNSKISQNGVAELKYHMCRLNISQISTKIKHKYLTTQLTKCLGSKLFTFSHCTVHTMELSKLLDP